MFFPNSILDSDDRFLFYSFEFIKVYQIRPIVNPSRSIYTTFATNKKQKFIIFNFVQRIRTFFVMLSKLENL